MSLTPDFDDSSLSRIDLMRNESLRLFVRFCAEQRLNINPNDTAALMQMGHVLVAEEEFDDARLHYLMALKSAPTYVPAMLNCGAEFIRQKDFARAEQFYRMAQEQRPGCGRISSYIGICRLNQADGEGAWAAFERAVEQAPEYAPPYLYLAVLHLRRSNYHTALDYAEKASSNALRTLDFQIFTEATGLHERIQQVLQGDVSPDMRH